MQLFPITHTVPHARVDVGSILFLNGVFVGLVLWSFALVWFGIAVLMLALSGGFPFTMGWWGFIFPIGTITPSFCVWHEADIFQASSRYSRTRWERNSSRTS
jgi:tellurite resistance protein TehA-like permease